MTSYFTKDHEYVRVEGDVGIIGITDYAQAQLGDVVYVDLPAVGKQVTQGAEAAVVESVKAASEVYAPVSGEIIAVNTALPDAPATVNSSPLSDGWFVKVKLAKPDEVKTLMDEAAYKTYVESLA